MSKDLFQPVGPECANVECQILCYSFQSEPAMLISQGMAHHDRGQGKKMGLFQMEETKEIPVTYKEEVAFVIVDFLPDFSHSLNKGQTMSY